MRNLLFIALLLLACAPALGRQLDPTNGRPGAIPRVIAFDGKELAPAPEGEAPRKFTFEQLVLGRQQEEEHQPGRDPLPDPHRAEPIEMPADQIIRHVEARFETPFAAGELFGMIVLAVGLIGWIALGIAVLIVERKQTKAT